MSRLIVTFITTLAVTLGTIAIFPRTDTPDEQPVQVTTVEASTSNPKETARVAIISPPQKASQPASPLVTSLIVETIPVSTSTQNASTTLSTSTMTVGSTTYSLSFADGAVLYDAMRALRTSDMSFTFTGHEYGSMGYFVDSLNNTPNTNGKYWFLYVNGTLAPRGVSQTILHTGDRIEWRYDDSY